MQISEVRTPSMYKVYSKKKDLFFLYSCCGDLHLPSFYHKPICNFFFAAPQTRGFWPLLWHNTFTFPCACSDCECTEFPLDACLNITKNVKNNSFFSTSGKGTNQSLQKAQLNNKTWELVLFLLLNHQIATFERTGVKNGRLFTIWVKLLLG